MQLLEGLAAPGEGRAPGLVGQRHGDRRARVDGQRLDRVALQRRAGRRSRRGRPASRPSAPGSRRSASSAAWSCRTRSRRSMRAQAVAIGAVQPRELLGVGGARGLALAPRPHRGPPAPGLDALLLELGDEAQQRLDEARRGRRRRERLEADPGDGGAGHALARQARERSPAHPGPARDLAHQAREGDDAHAEDRAGRRQLAAVVVDVGERRHDEDRLPSSAAR